MIISRFFSPVMVRVKQNILLISFFAAHLLLACFLGRFFGLAPDEVGYLFTFNNVYTWPINTVAQTGSGWITAPTVFLWIAYSPAKILNLFGVPDYLAIRFLSIVVTAASLYLLKDILDRVTPKGKPSPRIVLIAFFIPSVFLWTSVGLRESFIIAETTAFLVGLNFLIQGRNKQAFASLGVK